MSRVRALVTAGLASLLVASACGGDAAPPAPTTTTTSPAARQAGKEVCQDFYSELLAPGAKGPIDFQSRVGRATQAGPQLEQIFEGLSQLSTEKRAGTTPEAELEDRTGTLLASLEVVCQDSYGVAPPPATTTSPAR